MAPPEYQGNLKDIITKPAGGGANPTFGHMIRFNAMMPSEEIYCPSLQCAVYDNLLFGLSQPLIGNMFIPMGLIYRVQKRLRKNEAAFEDWVWDNIKRVNQGITQETEDELKERLLEIYNTEQMIEALVHNEDELKVMQTCGIYGGNFPPKILDREWCESIVIRPKYEIDSRTKIRVESNAPSVAEYVSLGYDPTLESGVRHWRYFVKKELENCPEIMNKSAFSTFGLKRGLSSSLFHAKKNEPEMLDVGTFKGWVNLKLAEEVGNPSMLNQIKDKIKTLSEADQEKVKPYIDIYSNFKLDNVFQGIEKEIIGRPKFVVRLYIIEAFNLSSRDLTSPSDPYLYIQLGDTIIDERDKHQDDTENPKFYSMYEFKADLVINPLLEISVFDYDYIGRDLIGKTVISLDDRYYSPFWKSLPQKPIEDRSLHLEESATEQGRIRLWVDIFKAGEETPAWNIIPQPDAVYSLILHIGIRIKTGYMGN